MSAGDVLQVLATGGGEVAGAAWQVLIALAVLLGPVALVITVRRVLAVLRARPGYCERSALPVGDDTIAILCLACNGPAADDCICTSDCGVPRCQAACPAHVEGCGPGANMLAYPSLACPACDWIAARLEGGGERG